VPCSDQPKCRAAARRTTLEGKKPRDKRNSSEHVGLFLFRPLRPQLLREHVQSRLFVAGIPKPMSLIDHSRSGYDAGSTVRCGREGLETLGSRTFSAVGLWYVRTKMVPFLSRGSNVIQPEKRKWPLLVQFPWRFPQRFLFWI